VYRDWQRQRHVVREREELDDLAERYFDRSEDLRLLDRKCRRYRQLD
jgi:hypothetical protein